MKFLLERICSYERHSKNLTFFKFKEKYFFRKTNLHLAMGEIVNKVKQCICKDYKGKIMGIKCNRNFDLQKKEIIIIKKNKKN